MSPETFIPIERTLKSLIDAVWSQAVAAAWPPIAEALDRDDIDEALQSIANITVSMPPSFRKRSRSTLKLALVFGAAASGAGAGNTIFGAEDPEELDDVEELFHVTVEENLRRFAATGASQLAEAQYREAQIEEDKAKKGVLDTDAIQNAVLNGGKVISSIGANQTTGRLAAFGGLRQLEEEGVISYRLQGITDKNQSKICRRLHGKKFRVEVGLDHISAVVRLRRPEDLKAADPWIPSTNQILDFLEKTGDNDPDLIANHWHVPPFHPFCRTIVINADIDVEEAFLETLPIVETAASLSSRLAQGADHVLNVEASTLRKAFENQTFVKNQSPPFNLLAWNPTRLAGLRKVEGGFDRHPIIAATPEGDVTVVGGRHLIALAAERGQTIKVASNQTTVGVLTPTPDWLKSFKVTDTASTPYPTPATPTVLQSIANSKVLYPDALLDFTFIESLLNSTSSGSFGASKRRLLQRAQTLVVSRLEILEGTSFTSVGGVVSGSVSALGTVPLSSNLLRWVQANWNNPSAFRAGVFHHSIADARAFPFTWADHQTLFNNRTIGQVWGHSTENTSFGLAWPRALEDVNFRQTHAALSQKLWGEAPDSIWGGFFRYLVSSRKLPEGVTIRDYELMAHWAFNFLMRDRYGFDFTFHGKDAVDFVRKHHVLIRAMTEVAGFTLDDILREAGRVLKEDIVQDLPFADDLGLKTDFYELENILLSGQSFLPENLENVFQRLI